MATANPTRIGIADPGALRLQLFTVSWMVVECSVGLTAAFQARSVSLLAFGADSLIELISAAVVLFAFSPRQRIGQAQAARACGMLLYLLAGIVAFIAAAGLFSGAEAETSQLGIAVTAGALGIMPVLAWLKRKAAARLGSPALRADAVQSATCAYLAALTLGGLLLRVFFGWARLDAVAALAAVPILVIEAKRARAGQVCHCC